MSGDHNQYQKGTSYLDLSKDGKEIELVVSHDFECPRCGHCCHVDEPVVGTKTWFEDDKVVTQNLYASDIYKDLPKREWQGLTGDEARKFYDKYTDREELIHAIDKFLEEKNT